MLNLKWTVGDMDRLTVLAASGRPLSDIAALINYRFFERGARYAVTAEEVRETIKRNGLYWSGMYR